MDRRLLLDLAVSAVALAGWFLVYGIARLVTRPASPAPAPATPELGSEPPAVVSLLVNRWSITEDAAESTLLDLAARGFVELRQPGNDPMQTTLHLPPAPPDDGGLRPYERRVLDRVRGLAVHGVVPLTALTFRDQAQAKAWNKRLRRQVVADARTAGLSRRRFGPAVTSLLVAAAVVAGVAVGLAVLHYGVWHQEDDNPGLAAGLVTFAALTAIAGASPGERDTALGREVAARWLGVRAWLRGHEQFDELPPASVAIWDRYLGYGAAVGATRLASAVLDLGMGDRTLVWSSFGGTWHRVRVRYPRVFARYGRTVPRLLLPAVISIAVGVFLLKVFGGSVDLVPSATDQVDRTLIFVADGIVAVALLSLVSGGYKLVRGLADLATERTITGEVLWVEVWRSTAQRDNRPSQPWLHYLAVDDGTGDRTTAWALPSQWAAGCHDGDAVTIRVRPWTRRVVSLSVVGQGRSRQLTEPVGSDDTDDLLPASGLRAGSGPAPSTRPAELFTPEEVGQALDLPVLPAERLDLPGPLAGAQFRSATDGQPVLMVQAVSGAPGRWVWRLHSRGQELPGIGDGAYASGEQVVMRVGDSTVVVRAVGDARGQTGHLPWLLTQGATRLSAGHDEATT
ncbi:DUF2207 family protein [Micromonospora narathiwatensis]|uniref:Predicted membrane protein (DUF2207) n=1 Tax=Micromonospora narathiwatensis TaxID=299146 RepID=A0A1A8ZR35_9ACTN|nr:DUF2207 domain-containing protein [Micromonospora narathiwatensis]SBT46341.1 Predicted membrane protein (DUF2207) [Micromonospora narathiwatensis]